MCDSFLLKEQQLPSPEPVSGLSQGLIAPVQGSLVLVLEISPVISLAVGSLLCFTSSPAPSLMCR